MGDPLRECGRTIRPCCAWRSSRKKKSNKEKRNTLLRKGRAKGEKREESEEETKPRLR